MAKSQIVSVDFNPALRLIWTERLPIKLPKGYCGGRRVRQYRHTLKNSMSLYDACSASGFSWKQDGNGVHMRREGF